MTSLGADPGSTGVLDRPRRQRSSGAPPTGRGGGDGDDGDGWHGEPDPAPDDAQDEDHAMGEFALRLAMVAISALFLVFLALLWNTRRQAPSWPPPGAPAPPSALWISTLLLAASSLSLTRAALLTQRANLTQKNRGAGRPWLAITLALGLGFLVGQAWAIREWVSAGVAPRDGGYGALFYLLLGAHGVHVVVGLIDLTRLTLRSSPPSPARVRLSGTYWHFMGVLWACVFVLLWWPQTA